MLFKQAVAITGRNHTGPPCSVGRPTAHAPGGRPARPPAVLQMTDNRRQRAKKVDGPVKTLGDGVQVRSAGIGSQTRLALQLNKAKKSVSSDDSYIKRANCVGAVGYAVVLPDDRIPPNDFFRTDIRFRVRLRYVTTPPLVSSG